MSAALALVERPSAETVRFPPTERGSGLAVGLKRVVKRFGQREVLRELDLPVEARRPRQPDDPAVLRLERQILAEV